MNFQYDDGGRFKSGKFISKHANDCVVRSIAIITGIPYDTVYKDLFTIAKQERTGKRKKKISSPRVGIYRFTYQRYLDSIGYIWTPTVQIGSGCKVHLRASQLPTGRLIVCCSRHMTAVIDHVIHDVLDPSRNGNRCVYGYWTTQTNFRQISTICPPASTTTDPHYYSAALPVVRPIPGVSPLETALLTFKKRFDRHQ